MSMQKRKLSASALIRIAQEYDGAMGSGRVGAMCVLLASLVKASDVEALVDLGIERTEAEKAAIAWRRRLADSGAHAA